MPRRAHAARRGTALVEFCVCLIAILVVVGGFIQIIEVGIARSDHLAESTRIATREMMNAGVDEDGNAYSVGSGGLDYIGTIDRGSDQAPHTADDEPRSGSTANFYNEIYDEALPGRLEHYAPDNLVSGLDSANLMDGYNFVQGKASRDRVRVLPVVRELMYDDDYIDIETQAVFPWTKGLY